MIYEINQWLKQRFVMWLGDPLEHEIDQRIEIWEVEKLRRKAQGPHPLRAFGPFVTQDVRNVDTKRGQRDG